MILMGKSLNYMGDFPANRVGKKNQTPDNAWRHAKLEGTWDGSKRHISRLVKNPHVDEIILPGLVNLQKTIENGPVEIVDLPFKNGDFP